MSGIIINTRGDRSPGIPDLNKKPKHLYRVQVSSPPWVMTAAKLFGFEQWSDVVATVAGGVQTNSFLSESDARIALTLQKILPKFERARFRIVKLDFEKERAKGTIYIKLPEGTKE